MDPNHLDPPLKVFQVILNTVFGRSLHNVFAQKIHNLTSLPNCSHQSSKVEWLLLNPESAWVKAGWTLASITARQLLWGREFWMLWKRANCSLFTFLLWDFFKLPDMGILYVLVWLSTSVSKILWLALDSVKLLCEVLTCCLVWETKWRGPLLS